MKLQPTNNTNCHSRGGGNPIKRIIYGSPIRSGMTIVVLLITYHLSLITPIHADVKIEQEFAFGDIKTLGQGVSRLVIPTFSIATAVVVIYFLIGAFRYLTAGGDKEATAGARNMITHAIIGFVILMFTFLMLQFLLSTLFGVKGFTGIKDLNIFGGGGP